MKFYLIMMLLATLVFILFFVGWSVMVIFNAITTWFENAFLLDTSNDQTNTYVMGVGIILTALFYSNFIFIMAFLFEFIAQYL